MSPSMERLKFGGDLVKLGEHCIDSYYCCRDRFSGPLELVDVAPFIETPVA